MKLTLQDINIALHLPLLLIKSYCGISSLLIEGTGYAQSDLMGKSGPLIEKSANHVDPVQTTPLMYVFFVQVPLSE